MRNFVYPTEKCRLRVFKNRMLRRVFGPKKENGEIT
jgi:hypothetical protein